MDSKEPKVLIEIRERLVRIETILQSIDFKDIEATANEAKTIAEKNAKDITELQSYVKWVVAAIIGAFITSLVSLVVK